jgi:Flp pilus assembly protein TadD
MFANKIHEEAHALMQSGDLQGSIVLYTKAMEEHPKDCNLISDRAVAYLHLNEKDKCFADFDLALSLQPNYGYRYASRAFAKNHFGDIDGAVEDYEKAVAMDPNDAVAQNNLGLLLEQKGYKNAAEERFKRADKLSKEEDHLLEIMDDLDNDVKKTFLLAKN